MQELNQVELEKAIGKTIKNVHVGHTEFVIIYTDNSFSCFKKYDDWGSVSNDDCKLKYEGFIERLCIRADGSTYFTGFQQFLIDAGVLDGEQLILDTKNRIDRYVEDCKQREFKEYNRLKEKFEQLNNDYRATIKN
jgi:hypothetical protein